MVKNTLIFLFIVVITSANTLAQTVSSSHVIKATGQPNEFFIKTTISGLEGVDLAKIEYEIPDLHTYKPSPKNTFFSDRKNNLLKFYIMAVPLNGVIEIEYNIVINQAASVVFPVLFQYSKSEEKNKMVLTSIAIDNSSSSDIATNEPIKKTVPEKNIETPKEVVKEIVEKEKKTPEPPIITTPKETKKIESPPQPTNETSTFYAIQLFALSEYSQAKVNAFCKKHNLNTALLSTTKVGGLTKVRYGKVNSGIAAQQLKEELANKGVTGVFVVKLP